MMTMKKPLYLDAHARLQVDVQGPVLTVARDDCAARWYPLPRLSRIVSRGPVGWSGEALCACMAAAVPVLFLDIEGRPTGLCTGDLRRLVDLGEHLALALEAPEGLDRFADWRASQEHRLVHHLLRALGWSNPSGRPRDAAEALHRALENRHGPGYPQRMRWHISLLDIHVRQALLDAGIPSTLVGGEIAGLNLGQEITRLAAWTLRGRVLQAGRPLPNDLAQAARDYAAMLESPMAHCLDRLIHHLWRLPL